MTAILLHNLRLKTRKEIRNNNIHVIGERKKFKSLDSSKNIKKCDNLSSNSTLDISSLI